MTVLEGISLAADTITIGRAVQTMKRDNSASKVVKAVAGIGLIALVGIGIAQRGTGSEPASPPVRAPHQDTAAVQGLSQERSSIPTYYRLPSPGASRPSTSRPQSSLLRRALLPPDSCERRTMRHRLRCRNS